MQTIERVGNIHIHTTHSDGSGNFGTVADAANRVGLDFLICTDHNVYVPQHQGWYGKTLVLVNQELHHPDDPHSNHLLVLDVGEDLAPLADNPQESIDAVRARGGLAFIAHPFEHSGAYAEEPEIDWRAWEASGYDGIELWNYMSEFKSYATEASIALLYAMWPKLAIRGPYRETLAKWDELLARGRVCAIGGSDAHATTYRLGPLAMQVFGYRHLFRAVNTHILATREWQADPEADARTVYEALAQGRAFVAYDGLAPARGFTCIAQHRGAVHTMGDEIQADGQVHFYVRTPRAGRIRLIANGFCVAESRGKALDYAGDSPGAYRVEVHRVYMGRERGWIYGNPIYVRTERRRPRMNASASPDEELTP